MLVLAFSVRSSIRPHVWLVVETHEIVGVNVGLEDDAASVAAIAAVRTATRDEFLTAEATATIPAITGLRVDANVIDEFHSAIKPQEREGSKFRAPRPNRCRSLLLEQRLVELGCLVRNRRPAEDFFGSATPRFTERLTLRGISH